MTIAGYRCFGWVDFPALLAPTGWHDPQAALLARLGEKVPSDAEARADALLAAVARLEPRRLGLPPYALARSLALVLALEKIGRARVPSRPLEPERALALLGRTAGGIFLASRAPRIATGEWLGRVHFWLAPITGGRR